MKNKIYILCLSFLLSAFVSKKYNQNNTGWLFYWGGTVVWFSDEINTKTETQCFFENKSSYKNGLKVSYIPDALYFKSIAKGFKVKDVAINGITKINNKPLEDDSVWILPVKGNVVSNGMPISGLSTIDTLTFKKDEKTITVIYSFEADYEINKLKLLKSSDKRNLKKVKNYNVYPPH